MQPDRLRGKEKLEHLRRYCPAFFYKPNKAASEEFILAHGGSPGTKSTGDRPWFESDAPLRISAGGNRAGKSAKLVLESGSAAVGFRPWYPPSSPWHTRGLPVQHEKVRRIRYVVPNFGTHLPEIIAEFEKWWPKDWWRVVNRDDRGTPREIDWFNGTKMLFMSHHMDPSDFEGVESDLNVWDEPPPKDLWSRLERGVVSTGGRTIAGCTLLDASGWFWDEVVVPGEAAPGDEVTVTWHSIWDNTAENGGCPTQTAKNVRQYLEYKVLDPDERLAREHGAPMHMGGLVLSGWNDDENFVDPFELPEDCHILGSIDPAGAKPFAGLFLAMIRLPDGEIEGHWFDEIWDTRQRDIGLFAETWLAKERGEMEPIHPSPNYLTLIDPIANEKQRAEQYGRSLKRILFEDYGIETVEANKQGKRARLLTLNARVRLRQYKMWRTLRRFRLEIKRWTWAPDTPKLTKGADDCSDCASYMDGTDPFKMFADSDEAPGGIWIPPEYRNRERREKEQLVKSRKAWARRKERGLG